jgi:hypothetical protein
VHRALSRAGVPHGRRPSWRRPAAGYVALPGRALSLIRRKGRTAYCSAREPPDVALVGELDPVADGHA